MKFFKPKATIPFINIPIESGYYKFHGLLQMVLAVAFFIMGWGNHLIPPIVNYSAAAIMFAYGCLTYSNHLYTQESIAKLSQSNIFYVTKDWVMGANKEKEALYVGKGFLWGVDSAQKYRQLTNLPSLRHIIDLEPKGGGKIFLHNLGKEEEIDRFEPLPEHTMIAGTTGVGKSQLGKLMLTQMIEKGEAVIIVDPKGDRDLLDGVYRACVQAGRKSDFQFFSLVHPNNSETIDPFANCLRANDVADRVKSLVATTGGADTSDPFINFCWGLVQATADLMMVIKEKVTPKTIYKYIVTSREILYEMGLRKLEICTNPQERQYLEESLAHFKNRVISYDQGHSDKMSATLIPILTVLGRGEIGGLLSPNVASIQIPDVIKNKRVVYMFLSAMTDAFSAAAVGKLVVQDIIGYVGQEYAYNPNIKGLNVFVDEFYSVVFPGYIEILNKARAAGVKLIMAMQTSADIAAIMGETVASQVIANTNNYFCLRIPEQLFATLISERSGEVNVPQMVKTRSINAGMDRADHLFKSGSSERVDMVAVPLVSPEQLTSLPKGEAFLITQGGIIVKLRIPLLEPSGEAVESFFEMLNPEKALIAVKANMEDKALQDLSPGELPGFQDGDFLEGSLGLPIIKVNEDIDGGIPGLNSLEQEDEESGG